MNGRGRECSASGAWGSMNQPSESKVEFAVPSLANLVHRTSSPNAINCPAAQSQCAQRHNVFSAGDADVFNCLGLNGIDNFFRCASDSRQAFPFRLTPQLRHLQSAPGFHT